MTLWHVKHDTVPLDDNLGSKYSIFPSSTFSAVMGLSAGAGAWSGRASHCASADIGEASNALLNKNLIKGFMMRVSAWITGSLLARDAISLGPGYLLRRKIAGWLID